MSTESTPAATHDGDVYDAPAALAARRAPRISQADVFRAADELLVQGDRPTIDRVRMRLGRGSPNTINDHLDDWWAKLGARLRDVPGHEFPQLPERVAQALQHLWNEALDGAHAVLRETLSQRELALESRDRELTERERASAARAAALEESLSLAREQLAAANQRAERLEGSLQERDAEGARLRTRVEGLEGTTDELRTKLEVAEAANQAERARLEERHTAAETRWLTEVDRARQAAKEATKEYERQLKVLHSQSESLQTEREGLRQQLGDTRSELTTAHAVREQLEARLRPVQDRRPRKRSAPGRRTGARHPAKAVRPR
jgi:hypothetical protein